MSSFEANKENLRHALFLFFNWKGNVNESRRMFVETLLTQDACVPWFIRFKSGDFDLKDKERSSEPKILKIPKTERKTDGKAKNGVRSLAFSA